jgi:hypothetical protein
MKMLKVWGEGKETPLCATLGTARVRNAPMYDRSDNVGYVMSWQHTKKALYWKHAQRRNKYRFFLRLAFICFRNHKALMSRNHTPFSQAVSCFK